MFKKNLFVGLSLLIALSMILAACGTTTTVEVVKTVVVDKEKEVIKTVEVVLPTPTAVPSTRMGGWLDTIVVIEEPSADAAISRMEAGEIDLFAFTIARADLLKAVQDSPNLSLQFSYGSYNEFTFNPVGPTFPATGKLNPFSNAKVREAINWLIDRNYLAQEVTQGMALPRYFAVSNVFAEASRYADIFAQWETYYAYNKEKATQQIDAEMTAMGATKVSGKWQFNGEPVTIIYLIRTEDERRQIGDYLATELESIGFTSDRQYKPAAEASPIWYSGNPADGLFHIYTGGWVTTVVPRTEEDNFIDFHAPDGFAGVPLWDNYINDPVFYEAGIKLYNREYSTLEERRELFAQVVPLQMQDAHRVWTSSRRSFTPYRNNVSVTSNLAGAVAGSALWPYTLRFIGEEGGSFTLAMPSILTQAWNPLGGSNWIYDAALYRATQDYGTISDPWTGLAKPQRIEKAEITAQADLPIGITPGSESWLTFTQADSIAVPGDVWVDWNPETQTFYTAADATKAREANKVVMDKATAIVAGIDVTTMLTATFAADPAALTTVTETLKAAVMDLGTTYNTAAGTSLDFSAGLTAEALAAKANEIAALADDAAKTAAVKAFVVDTVKAAEKTGYVFALGAGTVDFSTALVKSVAYYPADLWDVTWHDGSKISVADFLMGLILTFDRAYPASEIYDPAAATTLRNFKAIFKGFKLVSADPLVIEFYTDNWTGDAENLVSSYWPNYSFGNGSWHSMSIGIMAEAAGESAFTSAKAKRIEKEYLNYLSGPTLVTLKAQLDIAVAENYIPYAPTLGKYITADDATARWKAYAEWFRTRGHFWVGTGPYYIERAFPVEGMMVLRHYGAFVDLASKWSGYGEPKISVVDVTAPASVKIGQEATFEVDVTFGGEAYPASGIQSVSYLLFAADGSLASKGEATAAGEGFYTVKLTAEETGKLTAGSSKLKIVVVSTLVSVPSFGDAEFPVTAP